MGTKARIVVRIDRGTYYGSAAIPNLAAIAKSYGVPVAAGPNITWKRAVELFDGLRKHVGLRSELFIFHEPLRVKPENSAYMAKLKEWGLFRKRAPRVPNLRPPARANAAGRMRFVRQAPLHNMAGQWGMDVAPAPGRPAPAQVARPVPARIAPMMPGDLDNVLDDMVWEAEP